MKQSILFGVIAALLMATAVLTVRAKNLIHAALWLGGTLLATALLYAQMGASFLAGVQVLLYVGGIMTLMIFGVMITRKHDGLHVPAESRGGIRAAIAAVLMFVALAAAIDKTPGLDVPATSLAPTNVELGRALLVDHVLAFEVLSVLLLGTIIGAVVLARKRDHGVAARGFVAPPKPTAQAKAADDADESNRKVAA